MITIWRTRYVKGYDGTNAGEVEAFPTVDTVEGLLAVYETDAHFVPYLVLEDGAVAEAIPRLTLASLEHLRAAGAEVYFESLVFDIDCPVAHVDDSAAPQSWREAEWFKIDALPAELSDLGFYWTRGGYRLLYTLSRRLTPEEYVVAWFGLARRLRALGIAVDDLKDWTRCYRLPFVVRDGERTGDPAAEGSAATINLLALEPLEDEVLSELLAEAPSSQSSTVGERPFLGVELEKAPFVVADQITENRNLWLTSLAGKLHRALGYDEDDLLSELRRNAAKRCQGWEPEAGELERIARNVARYEAPPIADVVRVDPRPVVVEEDEIRFLLGSETEVARSVCDELEDPIADERLVYDRSRLFSYASSRGLWEEVFDERVRAVVHGWDGEWIRTGWDDKLDQPKVRPLKVGDGFAGGVLAVVKTLRSSRGFFDGQRDGLTFRNGFVFVDGAGSVQLDPFSSGQRSTVGLPFDYVPNARPGLFVNMLEACFAHDDDAEAKIQLLREYVGSCLLGRATHYQKGLVLLGDGGNGKSTFLDVVAALFVGRMITAVPPQEMANEYRRAMLSESRLNLVNELPEADILVSQAVKAILTGDRIVGRYIREQPFTFRPIAGHVFAANSLPGVRDMSRGFWRRWIVIQWLREFAEAEQDKNLAAKIVAGELQEVASWAVDGAAELAVRGRYEIPTSSESAVAEWRAIADNVARFLAERTVRTEKPKTKAAELYNAYAAWATRSGLKPLSTPKFGVRLRRLGVKKARSASGNLYGVTLRLEVLGGGAGAIPTISGGAAGSV